MEDRELVTAEELAARLRLRPSTIRRWARIGAIPALHLSPKAVRFSPEEVIAAIRTREKGVERD
jgi:predicted site-specific integrase-resolvase